MTRTYTVVGLHPDADLDDGMREATFVHDVEADTPTRAVREVRLQMSADPEQAEDIEIIAVFEGRHNDVYDPILDNEEQTIKTSD